MSASFARVVFMCLNKHECLPSVFNFYFYYCLFHTKVSFMSNQRPQKPTLTGQRFKTRKRGLYPSISLPSYTCTQTKSPCSLTWCASSFFFLFPSPPDEKERFDPTQFQESIVHGLNQTGTDLDAVAKFLDASGAKLDYRRYAETLFDILVAGGMLGEARCLSANWFACF